MATRCTGLYHDVNRVKRIITTENQSMCTALVNIVNGSEKKQRQFFYRKVHSLKWTTRIITGYCNQHFGNFEQ